MPILSILTDAQIRQFSLPPKLSKSERTRFFSLSPDIKRMIKRMDNNITRTGFILQLGYLKASGRFYPKEKFRKQDTKYIQKLLRCPDIDINNYNSTISSRHRNKILKEQHWQDYNNEDAFDLLTSLSNRLARNQLNPKQIFFGLIDLCWANQILIPSYFDLSVIVTDSFNHTGNELLKKTDELLNAEHRLKLDEILSPGKKVNLRAQPKITDLKKINQSLRPSHIKENIDNLIIFKELYENCEDVFKGLPITDQATEYYATWFQLADFQQLTQFPNKVNAYLRLLTFIKQQYYKRQDTLVDILLKSVTSTKHSVHTQQFKHEQATKKSRDETLQLLNKSHKSTFSFTKSVIDIVNSKNATLNEKYYKIEALVDDFEALDASEEKKLQKIDDYLNKQSNDQFYYDTLETLSQKLQLRVSRIIKNLEFDQSTSSAIIMKAIDYFKQVDGKINDKAPLDFLSKLDEKAVMQTQSINRPLYKALLFFHISSAIKSGRLNLKHSFRFRSIKDYMIDKDYWEQNKDKILSEAGLTQFKDGEKYLEYLKQLLDKKYHDVNKRYLDKKNEYLTINQYNKPHIKTPSIDLTNKEFISDKLSDNGFIPILKLLKEINKSTDFTSFLEHYSNKNNKINPTEETFLAGIIGKGCNIGIHKLANISTGITENKLRYAVKWCFQLKNIEDANKKIVETIHSLKLANQYKHAPNVNHTSSDGRKVNVAVDSLLANYSFKYFGREKGVSMYTFIDESQAMFYSTVFSSSDREAAYVIDGLMNNDVQHKSIHSTDTHGFTEQIFAATHFINVDFAPRFKKLASQKIYSFSARKTYQNKGYVILPSRTINQKLILETLG